MMDVSDKYAVVTEIFDNIAMLDTAARLELGDNGDGTSGTERQRHSLVSMTSIPPCGDQERRSVVSAPSDMVTAHHMVSDMVSTHNTLRSLTDHLSVLRKTYIR